MIRLFHGTSHASALTLLRDGWHQRPKTTPPGGQGGQARLLYLTTTAENAQWYAGQKEDGVVLELMVDAAEIMVDPEDGCGADLAEELALPHGLPGNLALHRPVPPTRIVGLQRRSEARLDAETGREHERGAAPDLLPMAVARTLKESDAPMPMENEDMNI